MKHYGFRLTVALFPSWEGKHHNQIFHDKYLYGYDKPKQGFSYRMIEIPVHKPLYKCNKGENEQI